MDTRLLVAIMGLANFDINFGQFYSLHRAKGPVTLLLRMRETYQKRMKINEIIFIRTKIL
jgi:hypothetical protein